MAPSPASITAAKTSAKRAGFDSLDEAMLAAGLTRRGGSTRHVLDLQQGELSALIDDLRVGRLTPEPPTPTPVGKAELTGSHDLTRAGAMLGHPVSISVGSGGDISGTAAAIVALTKRPGLGLRIATATGNKTFGLDRIEWSIIGGDDA